MQSHCLPLNRTGPEADSVNHQGGNHGKGQQIIILHIDSLASAEVVAEHSFHNDTSDDQIEQLENLSSRKGDRKGHAGNPIQAVHHMLKRMGDAAVENQLTHVYPEAQPEQTAGKHQHHQEAESKPSNRQKWCKEAPGHHSRQGKIHSGRSQQPLPEPPPFRQTDAKQQLDYQNLNMKTVNVPHQKHTPPRISAIFSRHSFLRRREMGSFTPLTTRESS